MMNKREELLDDIKDGKPVDIAFIPGHLNTPELSEEVFDVEKSKSGIVFKKNINPEKFITYIENLIRQSNNPECPIESRVIVGSRFYDNVVNACDSINKHVKTVDIPNQGLTKMSGFIWMGKDSNYPVSLEGNQIKRCFDALYQLGNEAIKPIPDSKLDKLDDRLPSEKIKDYDDIISGRC